MKPYINTRTVTEVRDAQSTSWRFQFGEQERVLQIDGSTLKYLLQVVDAYPCTGAAIDMLHHNAPADKSKCLTYFPV